MNRAAQGARALSRALGRLNETVGAGGRNFAGVLLAVMTVVILIQVVSRYVFNSSMSWSEELSKSLMVWTAFLVGPWAYRHGANVSIEIFAEAMPFRMRAALALAITALTVWILAIFFLESLPFVARGMQSRSATLPVSTGLFYLIVPAALGAMILVGVERFLSEIGELLSGTEDPDAPHRVSRTEA
jgi:TRAP-type C4-dicarboxylate transport system permease small subunit